MITSFTPTDMDNYKNRIDDSTPNGVMLQQVGNTLNKYHMLEVMVDLIKKMVW